MIEVMDYKTFFKQNKMLGDPKRYNKFAYVDRYPKEYMVERNNMLGHDGNSEEITIIFKFNEDVLISVEKVEGSINSIICSENFNRWNPNFVFVQTILKH